MFELYHQMGEKEVLKIFTAFPFMAQIKIHKLTRFLGEFRKYKLSPSQISMMCIKSNGLLGCQVDNFIGLFATMRKFGIDAKSTIRIIEDIPEFTL